MATWTTRAGEKLNPENMSTSHIKNCIKMLKNKGFISTRTLVFYATCPAPVGSIANDMFDMECDYVMDEPIHPFLDIFEDILEKRGEL